MNKKKPTLSPTHSCFDDSIDFLETEVKKNKSIIFSNKYKLVHGICFNSVENYEYAHAWIEENNEVIERKILNGIFRENEYVNKKVYITVDLNEFYEEMKVREVKKYSIKEMILLNLKHKSYGPWEEKFLKLCRDYKE